MNTTTSRRALLSLASRAVAIADKRSTMPVLATVLLRAEAKTITISATDLYMALTGSVDADTTKPGALAVGAKDLTDRLKMMPDGPLSLTEKDGALVIKANGVARRYTLRALSGDDYPPLPKAEPGSPTMSIPPDVLARLIAKTSHAISLDESRAHLNSALFEWDGDVVRAVATDGHRLALASERLEGQVAKDSMLLPLKAVTEIRRICEEIANIPKDERGPLTLTRSGSTAFFSGGGLVFSAKVTAAEFPPFRQVIPKETSRVVRMSRALLADAIKAVAISASDRTGSVKLALENGVMRLTSESPDSGEGADELSYELLSGSDKALVGVNAKYPLDALAALSCDQVDVGISGELDPVVIRPVDDRAAETVAVIMPVRI